MRAVATGKASSSGAVRTALVPVAGGGARMHTTLLAGETVKPTFVFLHGIAQNGTAGRGLIEFFHSRQHAVVTLDLPGHGGSDPLPDGGVSMGRFGQLLWDVLNHWNVTAPILACGHSAGGMMLLEAALQHPERVSALLLISTADAQPIRANDALDLRPMVEMMIQDSERLFVERRRVDFGSPSGMDDEEIYNLGMRYTAARGVKQVFEAAETYDVRTKLAHLTMPLVIMRGEDDLVVNAHIAERMGQSVQRARLVTAPGGHNWFLQRPDMLGRYLEEQYQFLMSEGTPGDNGDSADAHS